MSTAIHDAFGSFARVVSVFASSPGATALAFVIVVCWALSGSHLHYSDFWQLVMNTTSSVVTFLMVFVLNNTQTRDTSAINAKLDAIIFAIGNADNRFIGLEQQTASEAQAVLNTMKATINRGDTTNDSNPSR